MYRRRDDRRGQMIADITNDLRRYSVDAQHVGHAFAGLHGLNVTDLHALIAVMDAELVGDPITPGRLGEQLNLSSGSVTALIDRLERAGHIRRDRDTADRRKVFLHYADQGAAVARSFFGPLGRRTDEVMARFSDEELAVVHRFMAEMVVSMREHRDAVRAARGEPARRAAGADPAAAGSPAD
ncbi:MarR family winged helix-turn-helix transcriptional regulator [Micromonospora sp. CB01531]|uniref:MarR family winged helix-turn-helix transcriptional regulator n=1 Tax=Micromonospora sp. CB01531 TaxID=1718947 RepID=UPI000939AF5E|nr:MarR family transcriptional regulator [Micromonospora sp. CB01531]OKI75057.1 MarR family transcriptional regulator [Micromonospora sp. CB01531]